MAANYRPSDLAKLTQQELILLILRQQDLILRLEERVHQLEAQLHKDSHNSSLPPSQSPPPIKNLREKSGKPPGGQPGHPGYTLFMVDHPTYTIRYPVNRCERCGRDLSALPAQEYERRQVFDIPPLICEVTEYQAEKKQCICGHLTKALFPPLVQVLQYSMARIFKPWSVCLLIMGFSVVNALANLWTN